MKKIINRIGLALIILWLLGVLGRFEKSLSFLPDAIIDGALVVGIILLIVSARKK